MPHRFIGQTAQELSALAYAPLSIMLALDLNWVSPVATIITTISGLFVAVFAIRFYVAQTRKSEVERDLAKLELEKLKKSKLTRKKTEDDE